MSTELFTSTPESEEDLLRMMDEHPSGLPVDWLTGEGRNVAQVLLFRRKIRMTTRNGQDILVKVPS